MKHRTHKLAPLSKHSHNHNTTQILSIIPVAVPGQGWSTDKQMAAQLACLAPCNVSFNGGSKSVIALSNAVSFSEITRVLNTDISASGSIDQFSFSASASYEQTIIQERYDLTFNFYMSITLPTQVFQPNGYGTEALSGLGKSVYQAGPQQFRDVCGNQMIQQVNLGASLIVSMKVQFSSFYEKQLFSEHAGASWGSLLSVSETIQSISTQYNIHGSIDFTALQIGGDPTQLANIFAHCGSGYCVTSCSLTDMGACLQAVNGVITYAQAKFPDQIDFHNGTVVGSASPLSYLMLDLSEIGLNTGTSVLNATIISARKQLGDIYTGQQTNSTFVQHLLGSPFAQYMYTDTINQLRSANLALNGNLALLSDQDTGALGCYFHPERCPTIEATLLPQLAPINVAFLNAMNKGFIVSGGMYDCDCLGGCRSGVLDVNAGLFVLGPNSTAYGNTADPSSLCTVSISGNSLNIMSGTTACPVAAKISGYNAYAIEMCPAALPKIYCGEALGGVATSPSCGATECIGQLTFTVSDNPL